MNRSAKLLTFFLSCISLSIILATPISAASSSLRFQKKSVAMNLNKQERVDIRLENNGNDIIGIDLLIKFDPQFIRVIDIDNLGVFSQQMGEQVDNDKGIVKLGLANSFGRYQKSSAAVASLVFESLSETTNTEIQIVYESGVTTDSNVAITNGQDILTSVENLNVSISKENFSNTSSNGSSGDVKSLETSATSDTENDNNDAEAIKSEASINEEENKPKNEEANPSVKKDGKDYVKEVLGITDEVKPGRNYYPIIIAFILIAGLILGFFAGKSYRNRKKLDRVNY